MSPDDTINKASELPALPPPGAPKEPLAVAGAVTTVATATIGLVVAFGVDINDDQQSAILAFLAVVAPIIVAVWGRAKVFSPSTVRRMIRRTEAGRRVD